MPRDILKIIDQTNIDPKATKEHIIETCKQALKYKFRGVCVNPEFVGTAVNVLRGSGVKVIALIDPPLGLSPHSKRLELAKKARQDGADELDIVMNIIDMKYERYDDILRDLKGLAAILPCKVIIGSGYLTDEEIKKASQLAQQAGAFCVKTSTSKDPLEELELKEKARHLAIMKQAAPGLKIKAAGKIKTLKQAQMMKEAGADIIGTSSGVEIAKTKL